MKVQNESINKLNAEIRRKIDSKENELNTISKIYEKRIEEANSLGDQKYVASLDRNNQRILTANQEYEEKLKEYQSSLANTKEYVSLEEHKLVEEAKQKQSDLKLQSEDRYSKIYNNAKENEENIFLKSQNDAKELDQKARSEKVSHEQRAKQDLTSFSSALTDTARDRKENLKAQVDTEEKAMETALLQNKIATQARLNETTVKNKRLEQEQVRVQEDRTKNNILLENELIKQKQADFQIRYKQLTDEHQTILDNLTTKLNKQTKEAIEANVKDKKNITNVDNDPFYQLELLKPTMSEDEKNYYVHLEVPAHEKEDVHLMAHGRQIRLTMNKKFSSSIEDQDGSYNRTAKTQLYSKEFPVSDIMNQKQISQKYENGVLSFKIGKL